MIKLETAHIEELRGIRKLEIDFRRSTFAISGPNGSGKSGVIDAVEFGLTGNIARLTGSGTRGITISEHGPHVDRMKDPDAAFVRLKLFLPELSKSVTLTRRISAPSKPEIEPRDPDVLEVLAEVADHPEVTLSRREILRFILAEPSKRSAEIQAILKLEELGQLRSTLNTAQNKLDAAQRAAAANADSARQALQQHLQIATMNSGDVLTAVNRRRVLLGLVEFTELTADSKLDSGIDDAPTKPALNKQSILRDLRALENAVRSRDERAESATESLLQAIHRLQQEPQTLAALQRRAFYENGLALVEGPECPLCDLAWDPQELKDHILEKIELSRAAEALQAGMLAHGEALADSAAHLGGLLGPVRKYATEYASSEFAASLVLWQADLERLRTELGAAERIVQLQTRLTSGWAQTPASFDVELPKLIHTVQLLPDQSATIDAQTFLTTARIRLDDYREARRKHHAAEISLRSARAAYGMYCSVLEEELGRLYQEIEEDFCAFYRSINEHDEESFTAKLRPTEGKVALEVNFYERGLFPPAAYHSEGHQDGMGVCLYLALMKRLYGSRFTLSLLDDVVMSVDAAHRYQFCKLLKTHFGDTQFIITTHDRLWAEQMRSARLVSRSTSLAFHSWTVDSGPLVESSEDTWFEIELSLEKGRIDVAAAALRRHLEYVSRLLADHLGASVPFRGDGGYELGDLLPGALTRLKELYGKAAAAAQSWGNANAKAEAGLRKEALSRAAGMSEVERWAVNKAVHYNEWANFTRNDFKPVVAAFKDLLKCFRCDDCESWLYVTPRHSSESLRCECGKVSFNLQPRSR